MPLRTVYNFESAKTSVGAYCIGALLITAGVALGPMAMKPARSSHSLPAPATVFAFVDTLTLWDGQWYLRIAQRGYDYNPNRMSHVAFFPGYPMLIRAVSDLTCLRLKWAAVLVSNVLLVATYFVLFAYIGLRFPQASPRLPTYAVLAMALFPPTFFMRMAYSESMFLFLTLLAMYGMQQNWRLWHIVPIIGLATATRFVGLALLLPLAMNVWNTSCSVRYAVARIAIGLPLAASGLLGFVLYQQLAFGEPLAFAKSQTLWCTHAPASVLDKVLGLAFGEPLWLAYIPGSSGYVGRIHDSAPSLLSLQFANPIFFITAVALVVAGAWKGWLSRAEVLLSAGLILIPYAAKGLEMCMTSQARFISVAFPIYIVLGNILCRSPWPAAVMILVFFGAYLAVYSAMLAAGFLLF